jgi:hypothetical protein
MPGHQGGRAGRADRWRASYWKRMEAARTPEDRLAVAVDHVRTVIKNCVAPENRRTVADQLIADLVGAAEAHLSEFETRGKRAA